MIINLQLPYDKKGNILAEKSDYKPSKKAQQRRMQMLRDFQYGYETMNKPFAEFNDMSVIQRMNNDQKAFNIYQAPADADPDLSWKSNAIRPITRNKVISVAAHLTGAVIFPGVEAQNEQDEEDKDAAQVMRDLIEWANEQANYEKTFMYGVIAALVDPAVIINTEFAKSTRTVKEMNEDGTWTSKEVEDEIFSGFQDSIVPINELYINDIYESDIQKQGFLIRRRAIDYSVAMSKYGDNKSFQKYVRPGIQIMFNDRDGLFYQQYDESLRGRLVEEIIYYNRVEDLQLIFVNGVLLTDPDQPNPRKDKKYPFAKTGYEPINNGRFFYYKSLVFKMSTDQQVIDTLYRMVIDGTYLKLMPPAVVYGNETINASVMTPGTITQFGNSDTKLEPLNIANDLSAGYNTLDKVERSLSEGSAQDLANVQGGTGRVTALQIARIEENAKVMLGLFGRMIGFMVKEFGHLRISDIIQHLTVAEVDEITSESGEMKFRNFTISDKAGVGKSRKIEFDMNMPSDENGMADESEIENEQYNLFQREGGMDSKSQIYKVNPGLFRKRKFLIKVTPDTLIPPSASAIRELNIEEYDRAIANPLANQEAIFRDLLLAVYPGTKENPDKYIMKPEQMNPMQIPGGKVGTPEKELESPYTIKE